MRNNMRVLTIIIGDHRGGQIAWESLETNLLKFLNSDLALLFEDENLKMENLLTKKAKFVWTVPYKYNWDDYFIEEYSPNIVKNFLIGSKTSFAGGIKNNPGSGARLLGFRDILLKNYIEIIESYDQIILTRSDYLYIEKYPMLDNSFIWIPEGEDYGGLQDGHNVFPSYLARDVLSICKNLERENFDLLNMRTISPETILEEHFKFENLYKLVKRYERIQFSVATKKDSSNWSNAKYKTFFYGNLLIKYPSQFLNIYKNNRTFRKRFKNKINYYLILLQQYLFKKISNIVKFTNYHIKKRIHFIS
jgi:hypothetical protein